MDYGSKYTRTTLRALASSDELEVIGNVNIVSALGFIETFPFEEELRYRRNNTAFTAPIITFENDGQSLAVWPEKSGVFII